MSSRRRLYLFSLLGSFLRAAHQERGLQQKPTTDDIYSAVLISSPIGNDNKCGVISVFISQCATCQECSSYKASSLVPEIRFIFNFIPQNISSIAFTPDLRLCTLGTMTWETIAQDKKRRIDESIPAEWRVKAPAYDGSMLNFPKDSGIMTLEELVITESSAVELVDKMATGDLTSVAVTTAFCKRAALAQQLVSLRLYRAL